jgi:hypothetical protein
MMHTSPAKWATGDTEENEKEYSPDASAPSVKKKARDYASVKCEDEELV